MKHKEILTFKEGDRVVVVGSSFENDIGKATILDADYKGFSTKKGMLVMFTDSNDHVAFVAHKDVRKLRLINHPQNQQIDYQPSFQPRSYSPSVLNTIASTPSVNITSQRIQQMTRILQAQNMQNRQIIQNFSGVTGSIGEANF